MSKDISACFSSKTDNWRTPTKLYNYYLDHGYVDPCPYMCSSDNLQVRYHNQKLFINPPFSSLDKWADFVLRNACDNDIVLLIPSRTDTEYFHKLLSLFPTIVFIKGRLHYNDSKLCAPFPSMVMIFSRKCSPFGRLPIYLGVTRGSLLK